ncbi:MAG TPA: hypothetical protein VIX12_04690, partial [Candidatus Binataceae bacterium]
RAHPRWVTMRVSAAELGLWSFLMASAHGAGLMLFPILLGMTPHKNLSHHHMPAMTPAAHALLQSLAIVGLHTAAMIVVMGAVAVIVYEKVGLMILRSAWINLDIIWAGALAAAGALSLVI